MKEQFERTATLLGEKAMERLQNSTVAVFGIGGVGGHAAEALARSGVGTLHLIDSDTVSPSNINRQMVALGSTVGKYKVDVAAERIKDINPDIKVITHKVFFNEETKEQFDFSAFDYVSGKCVCTYEVLQFLALCIKNRMAVALPCQLSLIYETDLVTDFKNRIHVVGIDDGGHIKLMGNAAKNMKDVWLPYKDMFEKSEKAIRLLIKHGIDVQLYNFPLCSVKREYWDICSKSISDYKRVLWYP